MNNQSMDTFVNFFNHAISLGYSRDKALELVLFAPKNLNDVAELSPEPTHASPIPVALIPVAEILAPLQEMVAAPKTPNKAVGLAIKKLSSKKEESGNISSIRNSLLSVLNDKEFMSFTKIQTHLLTLGCKFSNGRVWHNLEALIKNNLIEHEIKTGYRLITVNNKPVPKIEAKNPKINTDILEKDVFDLLQANSYIGTPQIQNSLGTKTPSSATKIKHHLNNLLKQNLIEYKLGRGYKLIQNVNKPIRTLVQESLSKEIFTDVNEIVDKLNKQGHKTSSKIVSNILSDLNKKNMAEYYLGNGYRLI